MKSESEKCYSLRSARLFVTPPTLCDSMGYSPPDSSIHGISQTRILERVAISFSRASSQPRDSTWVPHIAGGFFTAWATRQKKCLLENTQLFFPSPCSVSRLDGWSRSLAALSLPMCTPLFFRWLEGPFPQGKSQIHNPYLALLLDLSFYFPPLQHTVLNWPEG